MTSIPSFKTFAWLSTLLAAGLVVVYAGDLVVLVLIATVLAYLLTPVVSKLERRGMSRTLSALLVFTTLSVLLVVVVVLLTPLISGQISTMQERWASGEFLQLLDNLETDISEAVPAISDRSLNLAQSANNFVETQQSKLIRYAGDAVTVLGNLVVVPFVLFFFLRDGSRIRKQLVSIVPNRYFEFTMGVLFKIDEHLGSYLRGQSLVAFLVGLFTTIGLGILGVDYYLMLGFLTGVANFIPYVGFVISALATLSVSVIVTGGFSQILWILIIFGVVQSLENIILQPTITARKVSLHPVSVLLAILVGGRIAGVIGMALAVPTIAILKVIIVETVVTLRKYRLS